jgi:serine protease
LKRLVSLVVIVAMFWMACGGIPASAGNVSRVMDSTGEAAGDFVADEIIVKFKNDKKPFQIVKVPKGKVKGKVLEYSQRSDVDYAEPNYYAKALFIPNDELYDLQWNLGSQASGGIRMEEAWELSDGSGVTVAVIDTGIAYENYQQYVQAPDLANTRFSEWGYDFVNRDTHPNDDNGHGTHVAGIIAQSTNNGIGVAGIAFGATLMPIKVLDSDGLGSYADIASGIRWAADKGAQVINLSLGGSQPSSVLKDALAYAYGKGVTIVAAAGNDGSKKLCYPAAYDDYVIAVGATCSDKTAADYSNHGKGLDLMAPGGFDETGAIVGDGILQQTFNPLTRDVSDFGYWPYIGTSMSSAHVARVAALVIARGSATTPSQVRQALQETALDLGEYGWDKTYGWGLVDAYSALNWPLAATKTVNVSIDLTPQFKEAGKNVFTWVEARVMVGEPGAPIANATVSGRWSSPTDDTGKGTTGKDGVAVLTSHQTKSAAGTYTFMVESVKINGIVYQPIGETIDSISIE